MNNNIIFDTDDALFAKPNFATGLAARFHDRERIAKLSKLAKHVIVSVDFIKQYVEQFNPKVSVIPTSIDTVNYTLKAYPVPEKSKTIIGWAGSASGLIYLRQMEPVLQQLSTLYKIQLKIISSDFIDIQGVDVVKCKWSLENEITDLQGLDIGIMPLANTEFERGKCGFKLIQYMGVGVPVVCSPVGINSTIVQDGQNGFLANSAEEWFDKLSLLIKDEVLREKFGKRGRESIQSDYTIESNACKFKKIIQQFS
jgi:glycosyltransferase involved in cell wall biosynthesis